MEGMIVIVYRGTVSRLPILFTKYLLNTLLFSSIDLIHLEIRSL
jgi:hypothetical protein